MKKLTLVALFIITAFTAYSQIDTTNVPDISQNVSRCNCKNLQFGDKLKRFRIENGFQKITMVAFVSSIASLTENKTVEFNLIEYDRIESNEFVPFLETQEAILKYISNY